MVDIFKDTKEKIMPGWAKFVDAGDSVQGTYVGKIVGQKDGYGNEQIIYQLLGDDGKITNVGFGLNKKFLIQDMEQVTWGQVIGFKFKGLISVKDRRRPGKMVDVKDFALHQDPTIINKKWLEENKDNMPQVVRVKDDADDLAKAFPETEETQEEKEDVPFPNEPKEEDSKPEEIPEETPTPATKPVKKTIKKA